MSKSKRCQTISTAYTKTFLFLCAVLVLASTATTAGDAKTSNTFQPRLNTNYKLLTDNSANQGDVPVVLYCWLGSPSCYQLESALNQWSKDTGIVVKYTPLIMRPHWRLLAKARLVSRMIGQEQVVVNAIYARLHQELQPLEKEEDLFVMVETLGMSASRFANLFYSPEINSNLNEIERKTKAQKLRGVPSLIIADKWYTDASMLKTPREFLQTIEFLLGLSKTP